MSLDNTQVCLHEKVHEGAEESFCCDDALVTSLPVEGSSYSLGMRVPTARFSRRGVRATSRQPLSRSIPHSPAIPSKSGLLKGNPFGWAVVPPPTVRRFLSDPPRTLRYLVLGNGCAILALFTPGARFTHQSVGAKYSGALSTYRGYSTRTSRFRQVLRRPAGLTSPPPTSARWPERPLACGSVEGASPNSCLENTPFPSRQRVE